MKVRESGRRLGCQNHLHQISVGAVNFEEAEGWVPAPYYYSDLQKLMPYLEMSSIATALRDRAVAYTPPIDGELAAGLFVCPSDPLVHPTFGHVSYLFSAGAALEGRGDGLYAAPSSSRFPRVRFSEIRDGLSNTALLSEHLVHAWWAQYGNSGFDHHEFSGSNPVRYIWYTEARVANSEDLRLQCRANRSGVFPINVRANIAWSIGWGYSHALAPNTPSCMNGSASGDATDLALQWDEAIVAAASQHPGGVNLALCDGVVRFVSDSIDVSVWGNTGTRSGNETSAFRF
jgi:hypothetical protein